jgi:hypothetical protein
VSQILLLAVAESYTVAIDIGVSVTVGVASGESDTVAGYLTS